MVRQSPYDKSVTSVELLTAQHTHGTARLHIAHLPEGFFPQLGEAFVRRWHQTFIDSPSAVGLVIRDGDGRVAAFLLATTDQHAYVRDVLHRDRFPLVRRAAIGLITHPAAARRFLRTRAKHYATKLWSVKRVRGAAAHRPTAVVAPGTGLTPVGVVHAVITDPRFRARGYGRHLLRRYEAELAAAGTPRGLLVTASANSAAAFYRRLGWRETDIRVDRDGREILQFERSIGCP